MTSHILLGEWWQSNAMFGGVFVLVFVFVFGLAWYVMRGDRLNRIGMDEDAAAGHSHGDETEPAPPSH